MQTQEQSCEWPYNLREYRTDAEWYASAFDYRRELENKYYESRVTFTKYCIGAERIVGIVHAC